MRQAATAVRRGQQASAPRACAAVRRGLTDSFEVLRPELRLERMRGADQKPRPGAGSSTCAAIKQGRVHWGLSACAVGL